MKTPSQVETVQPISTWLGFLSPEDIVVYQPPPELSRRLAAGFADEDDEPVFVASNRLALEAFRCQAPETAAMVCRAEIGFAAARLAVAPRPRLALLGLQPIVNLMRLNGYVADLEFARTGLAQLEAIADGAALEVLGLNVSPTPEAREFCKANCLIETAKILLRRGLHDELRDQSARLMRKWPRAARSGPFHCAEVAPPASGRQDPVLQRILRLHELARTGQRGLADALFTQRHDLAPRQLASLADSLYQLGDSRRGHACFMAAHQGAAAYDPALANLFRSRWLSYEPETAVPQALAAQRLTRDEVERLGAVALERLRWS